MAFDELKPLQHDELHQFTARERRVEQRVATVRPATAHPPPDPAPVLELF